MLWKQEHCNLTTGRCYYGMSCFRATYLPRGGRNQLTIWGLLLIICISVVAIPEAWTFWKKEPVLWTDFSYELPTQTVMCPSGSSSRRNRYRANWFSTRLALLYYRSIEICMGKIENGRNLCILLIRNRQPLPLNRAHQKLSFVYRYWSLVMARASTFQ